MNGRKSAVIARRANARRGNLSDDNEIAALPTVARNDSVSEFIWRPAPSITSGVYLIRIKQDGQTYSKLVVYVK